MGSRLESPVSPSVAVTLQSPPRELTRPQIHPEAIPITEVTSDEAGLRAYDPVGNPRRESDLNQEVVALTQRQLSHAINPPCCGKKGGGHKNGARK